MPTTYLIGLIEIDFIVVCSFGWANRKICINTNILKAFKLKLERYTTAIFRLFVAENFRSSGAHFHFLPFLLIPIGNVYICTYIQICSPIGKSTLNNPASSK